ncbi:hypothetical protein D3C85_1444120 [compost metagenome]
MGFFATEVVDIEANFRHDYLFVARSTMPMMIPGSQAITPSRPVINRMILMIVTATGCWPKSSALLFCILTPLLKMRFATA